MLGLYILWNDWPIFRISASKEHLQQKLEYTLVNQIVTAGEFQKRNLDTRENDMQKYHVLNLEKFHRNEWNASDCF